MSTFEEWRVTGTPGDPYPPYDFTFGNATRRARGEDSDPEAEARSFIEFANSMPGNEWIDGPPLHSRIVAYTEWEART